MPAMGVVALCLGGLRESDAYVGIFGFRYGWIPEKETRSITHIEYEDAIAYWKSETVPPIFLFLPKPGEDAAEKLEAEAVAVLTTEFPNDRGGGQAENRRLQRAFTNELRSAGTFVREFSTLVELGSLAQASVSNWNRDILKRALRERQVAEVDIPSAEQGQIGRNQQRKALQSALLAVREAASPECVWSSTALTAPGSSSSCGSRNTRNRTRHRANLKAEPRSEPGDEIDKADIDFPERSPRSSRRLQRSTSTRCRPDEDEAQPRKLDSSAAV